MDRERLHELCEEGKTQREIALLLDVSHTTLRYWLKKHRLQTKNASKRIDWMERGFAEACSSSRTIKEVIEKMGVSVGPGNYARAKALAQKEGLVLPDERKTRAERGFVSPLSREEILARFSIQESPQSNGPYKRWMRLIFDVAQECALCRMGDEWMGRPLTLELDHINGNRLDFRIENLRLLCPNCHSQQPTSNTQRRTTEAST